MFNPLKKIADKMSTVSKLFNNDIEIPNQQVNLGILNQVDSSLPQHEFLVAGTVRVPETNKAVDTSYNNETKGTVYVTSNKDSYFQGEEY